MRKTIFYIAATTLLLIPLQVAAINILPDDGLVPQCEQTTATTVGTDRTSPTNRPCTLNDFLQMLINLIEWFLVVLGGAAFLMFLYGGIMYVFSFGNKGMVKTGADTLKNTLLAILVILGAYTAVKLVASVFGVTNSL